MPFALVLIGLVLIVTGSRDTYREFGAELVGDFTGAGNFTYWLASLGAVGALGYVPALRDFSRLFMALIILAMLISNRGFFAQLGTALASGPVSVEPSPRDETPPDTAQVNDAQGFSILPTIQSTNANAQANFDRVLVLAQTAAKFFI